MSGFSAEWLSLRERYDVAARNAAVLDAVAAAFGARDTVAVVDLACGTGSTLRAIGARLPQRQSWRLVDNDLGLLAQAATLGAPPRVTVAAKAIDLVRDLEVALEGPLDLVTTSALLDLVSPEWLDRLIVETAARRLPVYAALTCDGRCVLEPKDVHDVSVLAGFNLHQRTDKGFGPALGPMAAAHALERFAQLGCAVVQGRSDWVFEPHDRAIQEMLLASFADVARLTADLSASEIDGWLARRRDHLAAGRSRLRIGHVDIFARPIGWR
jgi:hypothetical protein